MTDTDWKLVADLDAAKKFLTARGIDIDAEVLRECTVCRQTGGPSTCECHWCGGTELISPGTLIAQTALGAGDMNDEFLQFQKAPR